MSSGSPPLSGACLSEGALSCRDITWPRGFACLIVNGGLQPCQAFAEAQISRRRWATVTDNHSGVGDLRFQQLRWSHSDIVFRGHREQSEPDGIDDDRFRSSQLCVDADRRQRRMRVREPARQRCGQHPIGGQQQQEQRSSNRQKIGPQRKLGFDKTVRVSRQRRFPAHGSRLLDMD
ncbi:hypothetical protein XI01_02445 [Bradyrhizobium sp. CCBAU 21360]|uniref:Uncharacterized protein n=1 Tax=Bradyrhizobium ottawaense TaxID=931866 RepID=A0A2U8PB69_9BRAD|nr:hypothetical protein CIT37_22415 [Bradyrhizobium ottawaense]MDA9445626.1 hypothetical protein [Bradyrhizobium sp. CCBAU 21360]